VESRREGAAEAQASKSRCSSCAILACRPGSQKTSQQSTWFGLRESSTRPGIVRRVCRIGSALSPAPWLARAGVFVWTRPRKWVPKPPSIAVWVPGDACSHRCPRAGVPANPPEGRSRSRPCAGAGTATTDLRKSAEVTEDKYIRKNARSSVFRLKRLKKAQV
jgi:hypothetical protein